MADVKRETGNVRRQMAAGRRETADGKSIQNVAIDFADTDAGTVVAMLDLDGKDMLIRQRDPRHSIDAIIDFQFELLGTLRPDTPIRVHHDRAMFWQQDEIQSLAEKHGLVLVAAPMGQPIPWAGKMEKVLREEVTE